MLLYSKNWDWCGGSDSFKTKAKQQLNKVKTKQSHSLSTSKEEPVPGPFFRSYLATKVSSYKNVPIYIVD